MKYMLDTNICIALIRQNAPQLLQRLVACTPGEICLSSLVLAELVFGAQKSAYPEKNLAALEQFIMPLEVADFDKVAAAAYGFVRALLERQGQPIGAMDTLIGAHALSLDVILVTNKIQEFARIPNLKFEDWLTA
jgi:tRNA(fMet)-specific endonuclease VapC